MCGFFLLVSEQLVPDIAATDITPGIVRIIHLYVLLLKPTLSQETAHFWKFNNFLLRGAVFVNLVKQVILN